MGDTGVITWSETFKTWEPCDQTKGSTIFRMHSHPKNGLGHAARIAAFSAFTPAAGPSGWFHTQPTTARKSVPACTSGAQFSGVIPPIAQLGSSIISDHHRRISGSSSAVTTFVVDG